MPKAILCVDDEPSILSALQQQMMRAFDNDIVLEIAESGEEAIEIIQELQERNIRLAVLITDEMMPTMKGHQLIDRISSLSAGTPCILLTGYAQSEIVKQIADSNLAHCISKPWDANELVNLVRSRITQPN
jgi:DNA-binding NtrC family response regulator